jgi:hypothetical protein
MMKEFKDMDLSELAYCRGTLEGYIQQQIIASRRAGRTWASIATSLMCSTAEAHRRYSWLEKVMQSAGGPATGL